MEPLPENLKVPERGTVVAYYSTVCLSAENTPPSHPLSGHYAQLQHFSGATEFTDLASVFILPGSQECPTWGIRVGLLFCSLSKYLQITNSAPGVMLGT